jgi:hypothetical protein
MAHNGSNHAPGLRRKRGDWIGIARSRSGQGGGRSPVWLYRTICEHGSPIGFCGALHRSWTMGDPQ